MRTITYYLATNQVVESDTIYPNAFSADDNTTQLIFDYTGTACATWDKWLDLTMSDYTKDVQSLGTGTVVTFNLGAEHTKKGLLQVNPYAKNGTDKHGFPIYKLTIERQLNNSTVDASAQQSMIDYFDDRLTVKAVSATTLAPGESATASVTTEADGTTYVFGIPQGAQGIQGIQGVKGAQWRGAYSAGTAYVVDDVVSYNGSSYICILASTGNLPTNATYWSLVAQKGDNTTASAVTNTPAGNIAATNVQDAINELDAEKVGILPVATYTHTLNKEVVVTAFNPDTDTFTSIGHGLSNNNSINPIINSNLGNVFPALYYPGGMGFVFTYYVVNATADTFQLSLTSGGAPINFTENPNMDLTKWHFERRTGVLTINNLSPSYKYRVVIRGKFCQNQSLYVLPNSIEINTDWFFQNGPASYNAISVGDVSCFADILIDYTSDLVEIITSGAVQTNTPTSNIWSGVSNKIYISPKYKATHITSISVQQAVLANGSTVEVYKV